MRFIETRDEEGYFIIKNNPNEQQVNAYPQYIGTEYLDRTIYYSTEVEQMDGSFTYEDRIFAVAGSYLSEDEYKEALRLEEKYNYLNNKIRKETEDNGFGWRVAKLRKNHSCLRISNKE